MEKILLENQQIDISYHAMCRISQRNIKRHELISCLLQGDVVSNASSENTLQIRYGEIFIIIDFGKRKLISAWKRYSCKRKIKQGKIKSAVDKSRSSRYARRNFRQNIGHVFEEYDYSY